MGRTVKGGLDGMVRTKAWNDLVKSDPDITPLAYVALQVEAIRTFRGLMEVAEEKRVA